MKEIDKFKDINFEHINQMWKQVKKILEKETINPRIIVGGSTGTGKSSLINAILEKNAYETGVIPTTKRNNEAIWKSKSGKIVVVDAPGFGEAEKENSPSENKIVDGNSDEISYEENFQNLRESSHIYLHVIKADDRALEKDVQYIKKIRSEFHSDIPIICVVNQIDKIKPLRQWDPESLNLDVPTTEKEKNIRKYQDYLMEISLFRELSKMERLVFTCAGEEYNDPAQYGIDDLKLAIYKALPDAAKSMFALAAKIQDRESKRLLKYYSTACASAVAVNFLPASDALVLAPIQIAMVVHLGKIYGKKINKSGAAGILSSLGLSLAGRFTAQTLISFIPGVKNFVGPPVAYVFTYTMGLTIIKLFESGKIKDNKVVTTKSELDKIIKNQAKIAEKLKKK